MGSQIREKEMQVCMCSVGHLEEKILRELSLPLDLFAFSNNEMTCKYLSKAEFSVR